MGIGGGACAPQKVDPALIVRFGPAMFGCFWPIFFFWRITGVATLDGRSTPSDDKLTAMAPPAWAEVIGE